MFCNPSPVFVRNSIFVQVKDFDEICEEYGDLQKGLLTLLTHATLSDESRTLFPQTQREPDKHTYVSSRHAVWRAAWVTFNSLHMNSPQEMADYSYEHTKEWIRVESEDYSGIKWLEPAIDHISDGKNDGEIKALYQTHIEKLIKIFDAPEKLLFKNFFKTHHENYFDTLDKALKFNCRWFRAEYFFFGDALGEERFEDLRTAIAAGHCVTIGENGNLMADHLKHFWEQNVANAADYAAFDAKFKQFKIDLNKQLDHCLKLAAGKDNEAVKEVVKDDLSSQGRALNLMTPASTRRKSTAFLNRRDTLIAVGLLVVVILLMAGAVVNFV